MGILLLLFAAVMLSPSVMAAPTAYSEAVLADSPLLYYRLNELDGNAANLGSLGAVFDGAYNGAPVRGIATAGGDGGVQMNSADDFIESLATAPASLTGNPDFTTETIVRIQVSASGVNWPPFLHWGAPGTGNSVYFSLRRNDPDVIYAGFYNAGLHTTGRLCRNRWMHIVWVRDSAGGANDSETGTTLYINGTPVDLTRDLNLNPGFDDSLTVTSTTFTVNRATDFTRWANYDMDEVALFGSALSPAQVEAHWLAFAQNVDLDGDGVDHTVDNCLRHFNPGQTDSNGDLFGNACDPDIDNDFTVNFADLTAVKSAFFSNPAAPAWNPDADFDDSGQINFNDLQIIKSFFFGVPGPAAGVNFCGTFP